MKKARGTARQPHGAPRPYHQQDERQRGPLGDQLEVERIEHLHIIEAFIGAAAAHVMRLGYSAPDTWPALVQRTDGSRVQAPEAVVDRAIELVQGLCRSLDIEIRSALSLPPEAPRRKYRLRPPRPKDSFDTQLWLSPDERSVDPVAVEPVDVSAPVTCPNAPKEP